MSDKHMKRYSTNHQGNANRRCHYTPSEMAKIKKQNADKPSTGKNELELLHTGDENIKWYTILGNSLVV